MGHDDRTGFFFWEWFMALDRFNPLRRIGLATDQVSVLSDLCHCQTGPVYPVPRTPMTDARQYRSLFSRHRVAPPTPPYHSPPPSDEKPSEGTIDPAAELEGDPDEPYHENIVYPAGYEAYHSDISYGSERESVSVSSAPSSRHSSDDSSASGSIGYGEASSGSASDNASDDDLVNRHFSGTFP
ncbi:hypothetical protein PIB30_032934 [Stylosanthes scabra]|uniref:Uncharacterized protein n=1 Tax=Stylosanthes scabra TaxID=79078 RepID=A0ABU6XC27_9FABA|nr:hypothetical protein [Stylosanthes scabra]